MNSHSTRSSQTYYHFPNSSMQNKQYHTSDYLKKSVKTASLPSHGGIGSRSIRSYSSTPMHRHRPPVWYIKNMELFAGLSDEGMMEVISGMVDKEYASKCFLYTPRDCVSNVFILKEGEVTLYQSMEGKKIILDVLKPGSVFGNIGFEECGTERHFAEVTQKSYICTLPHNFFLQILQKRPDVALRALHVLSKRLSQYETHIHALSALRAKDRILATIRLLNEKEDASILPSILRSPIKVTHEKLGSMTGLTRETVTKQLQELEQNSFLTNDRKHIRLTEKGMREVMALA